MPSPPAILLLALPPSDLPVQLLGSQPPSDASQTTTPRFADSLFCIQLHLVGVLPVPAMALSASSPRSDTSLPSSPALPRHLARIRLSVAVVQGLGRWAHHTSLHEYYRHLPSSATIVAVGPTGFPICQEGCRHRLGVSPQRNHVSKRSHLAQPRPLHPRLPCLPSDELRAGPPTLLVPTATEPEHPSSATTAATLVMASTGVKFNYSVGTSSSPAIELSSALAAESSSPPVSLLFHSA